MAKNLPRVNRDCLFVFYVLQYVSISASLLFAKQDYYYHPEEILEKVSQPPFTKEDFLSHIPHIPRLSVLHSPIKTRQQGRRTERLARFMVGPSSAVGSTTYNSTSGTKYRKATTTLSFSQHQLRSIFKKMYSREYKMKYRFKSTTFQQQNSVPEVEDEDNQEIIDQHLIHHHQLDTYK